MNSPVLDKLQWRYATKKFDSSKKLSQDQVDTLCEAFDLTATSYGLQALKMVVISNQEIKEQLVGHSWNQQQLKDCSHVLVICRQAQMNAHAVEMSLLIRHDQQDVRSSRARGACDARSRQA